MISKMTSNNNRTRDSLVNQYGILSAIGNTPLIKLNNLFPGISFNVYAKLELLNPGGSLKDRPALNMINCAMDRGLINKDTTIVESSSGNIGIGIAQVCRALNLRFICVVDPNITKQNFRMLKAYGAELEMIDKETGSENYLNARIERVKEIISREKNSFWCNQYANLDNADAHYFTMQEIAVVLDNRIDYIFCAASTCGTLRGCYKYIKENGGSTKLIAVDAIGSVIFGGQPQKRLIPGHGAGRVPELYMKGIETEFIQVSDLDSIKGCHNLLNRESILSGGSSGAIVSALERKIHDIPSSFNCVLILCDRGERYLDTIYSSEWLIENFGSDNFID
jgi:2,3-diaminopropionate biosynthesis protein SbnA